VLEELDAIVVGEALTCRLKHGLGEVEAHPDHPGSIAQKQAEEPSVARPEVEDAPSIAWHLFEQGAFSFGAARVGVGPGEVAQRVLCGSPFFGRHARILTAGSPSDDRERTVVIGGLLSAGGTRPARDGEQE
jgi:hypothetical protein